MKNPSPIAALTAILTSILVQTPSGSSTAALLILPTELDGLEGTGTQTALMNAAARTYQVQVSASQLEEIGIGELITGLALRLDTAAVSQSSALAFSDYEITLAKAANPFGSISANFAANMIAPMKVLDAGLTVPADSYPSGGTPNAWGPALSFDSPYAYQGGDLVLLFSHTGNGTATLHFDQLANNSDLVGNAIGKSFYAQFSEGFQAELATDLGVGIAGLQFTVVPEPAEYAALTGLALLGMAFWMRKRRQAVSCALIRGE